MNTHLYYRMQLRGQLKLMEINDDGVREGDVIVETNVYKHPQINLKNIRFTKLLIVNRG